jgi:gamma-glutamylcyclotransferase (GGCT)/AIG2-like uncharacterized protein YtfP
MEGQERAKLVFQYGSNCLDSQINSKERLKGDARFISIAETVDDYELAFDVFSNGCRCAAANIVPKPGGKVWGVLYEIPKYLLSRHTAGERKSLDAIEGEGTNYERREIEVRKPNGEIVTALTYTVRNPRSGLRTDIDYVRYYHRRPPRTRNLRGLYRKGERDRDRQQSRSWGTDRKALTGAAMISPLLDPVR